MKFQRGGFVMGLIVGLILGLAVALGVALYVTKVPVPFVNKVPQRTAEQDAAEAEKNKNWDPNSPLYGKNPARPRAVASAVAAAPTAAASDAAPMPPIVPPPIVAQTPPPVVSTPKASAASTRDPAAILSGATPSVASVSTRPGSDPFTYFVQAGAFGRSEDADQQRAKLAMMGVTAKVTEREQAGRTMYRVRLGPFERKEDADAAKEKLDGTGIESALVRVQR